MISGGEVAGDSNELIQVSHELGSELWSSITNDLSREAMFTPDLISVDSCHSHGSELHVSGDHNDHL